jgi:hypothetical protein
MTPEAPSTARIENGQLALGNVHGLHAVKSKPFQRTWAESRQVVEIEHRHPRSSRDLSE